MSQKYRNALLVLLAVGVLVQAASVLPPALQELGRVRATIAKPAYWRSANFGQNQRFADYVTFLKANIPETSRVVLPPMSMGPRVGGHAAYMQYFLEPREVINCTDVDCMFELADTGSYLLVFEPDLFPGPAMEIQTERLLMFDGQWGLFVPRVGATQVGSLPEDFSGITQILAHLALPLVWLGVLAVIGFLFVQRALPIWSLLAKLSAGFGLGMALVSLTLYFPLVFGAALTTELMLLIAGFWLLAGGLFFIYWKPERRALRLLDKASLDFDLWQAALVALGLVAAGLAVGLSYHATDGIVLWGAKGYGIANFGLAAGVTDWGTNASRYPLNTILHIAAFKVMFGELLPASKLLFPALYLGALLIGYEYLKTRIGRGAAGLGMLFLGTVPLIFEHGELGTTNLSLAYYQAAAVIFSVNAFSLEDRFSGKTSLFLGGLFFALSAWTRPEGQIVSIVFLGILMIYGYRNWERGERWKDIGLLLSPFLIFTTAWSFTSGLVYLRRTGTDGLIANALRQMINLNFDGNSFDLVIAFALDSVTKFEAWGLLGSAVIVLALLSFRGWHADSQAVLLVLAGVSAVALMMAMMYAVTYIPLPACGVACMLRTALDRFSIPGVIILWVGVLQLAFRLPETD